MSAAYIHTVKPDGSGLTRLFAAFSDNADGKIKSPPTWSPNGERIAFLMGDESDINIHTIDRDGRGLSEGVDIPTIGGIGGALSWNPVDASLILASIRPVSYIVNTDEPSVLIISRARGAAWSPDGAKVAVIIENGGWARFSTDLEALRLPFAPDEGKGDASLFVMSPDGSDARLLAVLGEDGTARTNE